MQTPFIEYVDMPTEDVWLTGSEPGPTHIGTAILRGKRTTFEPMLIAAFAQDEEATGRRIVGNALAGLNAAVEAANLLNGTGRLETTFVPSAWPATPIAEPDPAEPAGHDWFTLRNGTRVLQSNPAAHIVIKTTITGSPGPVDGDVAVTVACDALLVLPN